MKQRKAWTKEEDEVLRLLRQFRGQKKWSAIAKKMEEQFSISGRSGKQCRQRYHNHLDSSIKTSEWTPQEERVLFQMHEQVGNRWSVISHRIPGRQKLIKERTDNCVKNHFYSKLRKAVRKINKIISQNYKKEYKQIKTSLLYKIIETSESKFKVSSLVDEQVADYCSEIKNKLYYFQQNYTDNQQQHIQSLKALIEDILNFGKNDKRVKIKHRKSSGAGKDLLHPNMYLKKVRSNSEYSSSQFSSSRYIQSSSYGEESDNEEVISIGHKSMMNLSKKQTNPSRTLTSNTNLRLTRSRSKQQTFSSNKSPQCYSDDIKIVTQKRDYNTFTGQNFLTFKHRSRNPSFQPSKSDWSHNENQIEQILQQDNILQEKSSGSNKHSRNSRSHSQNKSHVNLFFEDSQFQMRILSPKNFPQQQKMSQQELFDIQPMQVELEGDNHSQDSIKTFNLGKELGKFSLDQKVVRAEFQNPNNVQYQYEYQKQKQEDISQKQKQIYQYKHQQSDENIEGSQSYREG